MNYLQILEVFSHNLEHWSMKRTQMGFSTVHIYEIRKKIFSVIFIIWISFWSNYLGQDFDYLYNYSICTNFTVMTDIYIASTGDGSMIERLTVAITLVLKLVSKRIRYISSNTTAQVRCFIHSSNVGLLNFSTMCFVETNF